MKKGKSNSCKKCLVLYRMLFILALLLYCASLPAYGYQSDEDDPTLPKFTFDYNNYSVLQYTTKDIDHMRSVDLNDIVIYASMDEYTDLVADPYKVVRIVGYSGGEIARGHFVPYPEFEETYGIERSKALILKLDEPFEKGSMKNYTGPYYLDVPAATFGDKNFGDYINDAIPKSEKPKPEDCRVNARYKSFTFYLDDSKADIETPSDEVWRKAYNLLKLEGVGYPTSTCTARKSLEAKVDSRVGSDSQYETAINNFYNTADVTMPLASQFYRIKAISDSTEVYLGYDGKHITLVEKSDATGFVATQVSGNTYGLQLGDSRFVQQFSATDNVTNEYSPINDFTLTKLTIEGVDAEKTFGKFSLKTKDGYAGVDVKNKVFMEEIATPSVFTKGETCAFVLEEVKDLKDLKAPDYIPVLDPRGDDEIRDFKRLNIIFDSYPEITLSDSKKIKLYGKSSKDLAEITVTPNENQRNAFIVDIAKLPQSTRYTLSIEQGAFTFSFAREPREIGGFIAIYDNVTGITSIYVDVTDEPLYDLQGRKVSGNLKSGIYIKNGKKVYIK